MAEVSTFRGTLLFFDRLGVYDVILPFLLVFTIVFAILDKTKVLGTETIEGQATTKKNLNAMVSFVIAFLVVASSQLVAIINKTASQVVILLLLSVLFLMLIGSFSKEGEPVYLQGGWRIVFMVIMFVGIILIFLNAIEHEGTSWLMYLAGFFMDINNSETVSSIVLVIVTVLFMWYIMHTPKGEASSK